MGIKCPRTLKQQIKGLIIISPKAHKLSETNKQKTKTKQKQLVLSRNGSL